MWRASSGTRVLTESEWALFAIGLDELRMMVEEDISYETDDTETGVTAFDRLTPEQKLCQLAKVGIALRDKTVPEPKLTAVSEGTVKAVFNTLRNELLYEIDTAKDDLVDELFHTREAISKASAEEDDQDDELPDLKDGNTEEWMWLLEEIEDRILWDNDHANEDDFIDLPREEAKKLLDIAGIDPDYFLFVPEEPTETGLIKARQILAKLLSYSVPNDDGLYPILYDHFHDISVGRICEENELQWKDHPWISCRSLDRPVWNCRYDKWIELFSSDLPAVAFYIKSDLSLDEPLPSDVSAVKVGQHWVIKEDDSYWCDLLDNGWIDELDNELLPPLTFDSEQEAIAAYNQAQVMYLDRSKRHQHALDLIQSVTDN